MPHTVPELLERREELAALTAAADAAANGAGRMVVVSAEAGLGKTALLRFAGQAAERAGARLLRSRGSDLEQDLPFGIVTQLLGRRAVPEPVPTPLDAVTHALWWKIADLAAEHPLVVIVDDAHWADEPSLLFLLTAAQRIRDTPLTLIVAARPAEPGAQQPLVRRLTGHEDAELLSPRALTEHGVARLIAASGLPEAGRASDFAAACSTVTGGNPLLLIQLLAALEAEGVAQDEHGVARIGAIGPDPVQTGIEVVLDRLGPEARAVAHAVAVLGDGAPKDAVARLAGLDPDTAARATGSLETGGLFRRADSVGFAHPLMRSAVYQGLAPSERGRAHRCAAQILHPSAPAERIAAHLLVAPPAADTWAVDALMAAARRAVAGGAPDVAARQLERALAEQGSDERRGELLAELARARAAAGLPAAAAAFEAAVELAADDRARAGLRLELGRLLTALGQLPEARAALDRGMTDAETVDDRNLQIDLRAAWVSAAIFDPAVGMAAYDHVQPLVSTDAAPRTLGERRLLGQLAGAGCFTYVDRAQVIAWGLRAWGEGALLALANAEDPAISALTGALSFADAFPENDAVCDALLAEARRSGSALGFATASFLRGGSMAMQGRLPEAIADLEAAVDARAIGWRQYLPRAIGLLALSLFEAGDSVRCDEVLALGSEIEEEWSGSPIWASFLEARGFVDLSRGRAEAALPPLRRATELIAMVAVPVNPTHSLAPGWTGLALKLLDRADEAGLNDEEVALARRWGAPRALGSALRTRGLVRGDDGLDDLRESAAVLAPTGLALEHARTLNALGSELLRRGERAEARDVLRVALDLADSCGAHRQAELAREEAVRAGARPQRARLTGLDALTPGERRVARMAGDGLTNREIAEALFVTGKAVEWHLGNTYRKLGVNSRESLRALLADQTKRTTT